MLAWLLHVVLSTLFAIYLFIRRLKNGVVNRVSAILNHHHRSPDRYDLQPSLRCISDQAHHQTRCEALKLDILIHDACEIAAWCTAAEIPVLSIYERTGLLKSSQYQLHARIEQTLDAYYGSDKTHRPSFSLRAPNLPSYSPPHTPEPATNGSSEQLIRQHLSIILLDASDGRQTLIDLTRTLAEMSQNNKLQPHDISPELIDAEISESIMGEPDLLILFGDKVMLDGYPPWQVRLTEIFAMQDYAGGVGYNCFLRALYKYANAQMRLGR